MPRENIGLTIRLTAGLFFCAGGRRMPKLWMYVGGDMYIRVRRMCAEAGGFKVFVDSTRLKCYNLVQTKIIFEVFLHEYLA